MTEATTTLTRAGTQGNACCHCRYSTAARSEPCLAVAQRPLMRLRRSTIRSINSAGRFTDKAVVGLVRFATTDHTGISQRLADMPDMGFLDSLKYILLQMLISILAAIVTGVMTFLLIAYGIPFLLHCLQ